MNEQLNKVAAHYDKWAEKYDEDYFITSELYHTITLENIKRYLPNQKKQPILDAGGGTGIWAVELAKMGYKVTIVDISEGMLEKARKKIMSLNFKDQIDIQNSDICNLEKFCDESFAMVLCEGNTYSFCDYHLKALKEMIRVLKPGGIITVSVYNKLSAINWLRDVNDFKIFKQFLQNGRIRSSNGYVIRAFSPMELKNLFRRFKLKVERLVGIPVISNRLSGYNKCSSSVKDLFLRLEKEFCDDEELIAYGGQLEIVGRKILN